MHSLPAARLQSFANELRRAGTPADNGQDAPAPGAGRQRVPDSRGGALAKDRRGRTPERGLPAEEGAEGHGQT